MNFTINISDEQVEVDIKVNERGNLVLDGMGLVTYEFYGEELILTRYYNGDGWIDSRIGQIPKDRHLYSKICELVENRDENKVRRIYAKLYDTRWTTYQIEEEIKNDSMPKL